MQSSQFSSSTAFARMLRRNQTREETIMWGLLRNRQCMGYKFVRQHPIKVWETSGRWHYYYADFYCAEKRLVVEIDGLIHCLQEDYDRARDTIMFELRLQVLRVWNKEVNEDLVGVLRKITSALNSIDSSPDPFSTL